MSINIRNNGTTAATGVLSRANLAARSGVGRAGGRAAVLGRVHGAARVHLPAAVAAHLLRGPVPPRYVSSRLY